MLVMTPPACCAFISHAHPVWRLLSSLRVTENRPPQSSTTPPTTRQWMILINRCGSIHVTMPPRTPVSCCSSTSNHTTFQATLIHYSLPACRQLPRLPLIILVLHNRHTIRVGPYDREIDIGNLYSANAQYHAFISIALDALISRE